MRVENYDLYAQSGRRIRTATRVVLDNSLVIAFVERLSKREALRQASLQLARIM